MNTIYFDPNFPDDIRRKLLYEGQLIVYSPRKSSREFCAFARSLIEEAFSPLNPESAQYHMPVEQYAGILNKLKPYFIHHPQSKKYLQAIFQELECDLSKTYTDVPKMRSSTSDNYLTTGIAYAWHPHRDTWYSAPSCQINWWLPIYPIESDNTMAFHPHYWNRAIQNDSSTYNYYEHNLRRHTTGQHLKDDPRPLPKSIEPIEMDPQIRLICQAGGIIMFSAAQLHSSVPNISGKTRFSIDFRTVHLDDVVNKHGAKNLDAKCTGTTMRDYLRGSDLSHIPDDIVALYDDGTEKKEGVQLEYTPPPSCTGQNKSWPTLRN